MKWGVVTILPRMVHDALNHGVVGRALASECLTLETINPRNYAGDAHKSVDDRPYGGGPGMLMKVDALRSSISDAKQILPAAPVIYLSPQGERLTQELATELAKLPELILVCGRYEGIDERVIELDIDREISLGDFVLSGGEAAAIAILDVVGRLVPGVLGHSASAIEDSFSDGILDFPHYTRPKEFLGLRVPDVLLSGHHESIAKWRRKQALGRTWSRRPDLLKNRVLSNIDRELLNEFIRETKQ